MPYRDIINFRVSAAMRADLEQLAKERETDIGKLLRQLIARELSGAPDQLREQREQILFLAIAMDGLLAAHPDTELRPRLVRLWQQRLAREGSSHAA
jgi:hypothetical protein